MKTTPKVGDAVRYTKKFCRSIGASPTCSTWSRKGTVIEVGVALGDDPRFTRVQWSDDAEPQLVATDAIETPRGHYVDSSTDHDLMYERIHGLNGHKGGK